MKRTIILANGQFPRRREALQAMLDAEILVCCDGAYNKLVDSRLFSRATTLPQVFVVGDGDSLDNSQSSILNPQFIKVSDQETNDLTKAVRFVLEQGAERAVILGATGLREDHTLGNVSLLSTYSDLYTASGNRFIVKMFTDYGFFTPISESTIFPSFAGQQVSLFSLSESLIVTVDGLKYPISGRQLRYWWEATLNEALGDNFTIALEGVGKMLVYQTFDAK